VWRRFGWRAAPCVGVGGCEEPAWLAEARRARAAHRSGGVDLRWTEVAAPRRAVAEC
jgi:hypothetical protein